MCLPTFAALSLTVLGVLSVPRTQYIRGISSHIFVPAILFPQSPAPVFFQTHLSETKLKNDPFQNMQEVAQGPSFDVWSGRSHTLLGA